MQPRKYKTALALSIWLGGLGVDRFYLGYTGLSLLKLFSFAGLGIWWLVDIIMLATREMKDAQGQELEGEGAKDVFIKSGAAIGGFFAFIIVLSVIALQIEDGEKKKHYDAWKASATKIETNAFARLEGRYYEADISSSNVLPRVIHFTRDDMAEVFTFSETNEEPHVKEFLFYTYVSSNSNTLYFVTEPESYERCRIMEVEFIDDDIRFQTAKTFEGMDIYEIHPLSSHYIVYNRIYNSTYKKRLRSHKRKYAAYQKRLEEERAAAAEEKEEETVASKPRRKEKRRKDDLPSNIKLNAKYIVKVRHDDTLNVRETPAIEKGNIIDRLDPLEEVKVVGYEDGFARIEYGFFQSGWVSTRYIVRQGTTDAENARAEYRTSKEKAATKDVPDHIVYNADYIVRVNDFLNVRSTPSIQSHNILDKLYPLDTVRVVGYENGFAKVEYGYGNSGWASAAYLVRAGTPEAEQVAADVEERNQEEQEREESSSEFKWTIRLPKIFILTF